MTALPQTAATRITLAIALSLLVHAIVLFAPMVTLPKSEVPLPPLTARLEPLPAVAAKPAPAAPPKPQPKPQSLPAATGDPDATDAPAQDGISEPTPTPEIEKTTSAPHPLPKHAQLTFVAYMGTSLRVGEARHRLDIGDEKNYILEVRTNTTGLASMFKSFEALQRSTGTLTPDGLRPDEYSESKKTSNGKENNEAQFIWQEGSLHFSSGNQVALPERTQDMISFLYQLSQLPLDQNVVPIYISNGKKLERYELIVGAEEYIQTDFGRLRTLPLHKLHGPGEEGLDIWLGLEYRLLPVKVRQTDREGHTAGEMVVSGIGVADE